MVQTVEELAQIINEIKSDTDKKVEDLNKILANISRNIEMLSNEDEAGDLLKVYFSELKKVLEERHALVVSEFSNIGKAFDTIEANQQHIAKSGELQTVYNNLANNLQMNLNELYSHHTVFEDLNKKIDFILNDKTDKTDIINAIGLLRQELEIIDTNYTKTASEIQTNTQSIIKNLIVMDPSAQNDIVKRELENIYMTSNSILSILNDAEQHNNNIFNSLDNLVTKEDFEIASERINNEISDGNTKINGLLEILSQKADDIALAANDSKILYEFENIKRLLTEQKGLLEDPEQPEKINNISSLLNVVAQKIDILQNSGIDDLNSRITQVISQGFEQLSASINNIPTQTDYADLYRSMNDFSTILDTLKSALTASNNELNSTVSAKLTDFQNILNATITEEGFSSFRHDLAEYIQNIINNSAELNNEFKIQKETLTNIAAKIEDFDSELNLEAIKSILSEMTANSASNRDQIIGEIKSASSELIEKFEHAQNTEAFKNFSRDLELLKESISSAHESNSSEVNEKFSGLRDIISEGLSSRDEKFSVIEAKLNEFIDSYNKFTNDTGTQIGNSVSDVNNMKSKIEDVASIFTEWEAGQSDRDSKLISMITNSLGDIQESFSELQNSVRGDMASQMYQSSNLIKQQIDNLASYMDELKAQFNSFNNDEHYENLNTKIETFSNEINNNINLLKTNLSESNEGFDFTEKLLALRDILLEKSDTLNEQFVQLSEKIDNFINAGERISSDTDIKIGNSISELTVLKEEIEAVSKAFAEWNYNYDEHDSKIVGMISSELDELKESVIELQDSVHTGLHQELASTSEFIDNKINTLVEALDQLKSEISEKPEASNNDSDIQDIKDKINAVKQEINLVNTDVIDVINSKAEALMLEFAPLKALLDNTNTSTDTISDSEVNQNNDEILDAISDLKEYISEVCGGYGTTNGEEELKNIISAALSDDSTKWAIDDLKTNFATRIEDSTSKIKEMLDIINEKVNSISSANNDDIIYNVEEIKNMISSQKDFLETSGDNQKISEVQEKLSELVNKIENVENIDSNISEMRESIIEAILNVFEQISFIEESEDIKDFVEEKTDEINQNIIEVKQQLKQFVDNSDDEYTYTLQDVESDIAKLRMVINDLSNSSTNEEISDISNNIHRIVSSVEDMQSSLTQDQISGLKSDFEKLSEDVLSISSRTNKLILSSDESYNALSNGLNDFSNVISQLEERINYLDNKEITERIEEKLNSTYNVVTASANSDKVMRQALTYMGEWIDTASENLQSLCENSDIQNSNADEIKDSLEDIRKTLPEQREILNTITMHFEEQQERMDRLELKLEKILTAIDNIDDTKLVNKVDKVDKQVKKLSSTIEKLATYVDE